VSPASDVDWDTLLRRIERGTCTPFLGAGASGDSIPVGEKIAKKWAETHSYPLADAGDLVQVAQFLAVKKEPLWPKEEIQELFDEYSPPNFTPDHPYSILASLPLSIYLTTNYDDFLVRALVAERKRPVQEFCRWTSRPSFEAAPQVFEDGDFSPSEDAPLVYHLHGRIDKPASLVLTEDDYVEFLVNMARADIIPPLIKRTIAENMLLFIGYRLADWSFRVLYRGVMKTIDASGRAKNLTVQLEPEDVASSPAAVKEYLEAYFDNMEVRVYWGRAQDFLAELAQKRAERNGR
jgi:hypothetical protein